MKRALFALPVAIAGLLVFFESIPQGASMRDGFREWLAAGALPAEPETITVIELPPPGGNMPALDAALALRAVLRCQPRAVAFLDPIEPGEAEELLLSKLSDARLPVVFTANERLDPFPRVVVSGALPPFPPMKAAHPEGFAAGGATAASHAVLCVAARQGGRAVASNVWQFCMTLDGVTAADVSGKIPGGLQAGATFSPVDAAGCARINPLAARYVRSVTLDQLMLRTERSERGEISADLTTLFQGRLVAIQTAGENRALGLAALRNNLAESPFSAGVEWIGLLVVAMLPWWRSSRINRALFALGVSCAWLLLALAIYQEFRIAMPISIAVALPLLALIPPGRAAAIK